jgi:hypothetical protein
MSQLLLRKIEAVRRKHAAVTVGSGLAAVAGGFVLALALEMLLDWLLELPRGVRAALLALDLAGIAWVVLNYMVWPVTHGPDDDVLALQVEAAEPGFGHRLIAAMQLSRPNAIPAGASKSLVRALVAQTEDLAHNMDFTRVVKTDRLMRLWLMTAVIVLLGLGVLAWGAKDNASIDLLERAFLADVPVPRKTHVEITAGNLRVPRGDPVTIQARARGVRPAVGTLYIQTTSNRLEEFSMEPDHNDSALFSRTLDNVQESFRYWVKLNDGRSDWFDVTALVRPAVLHLEAQQVYPAYTGLGTVARSLGDLTLLNGSSLALKVTANHRVREAGSVVHLIGAATGAWEALTQHQAAPTSHDVPLRINNGEGTELVADVPLPPRTTGFCINLVDQEGLASKDPVVYRVDLVADKDPTVRITAPERKESLLTRIGHILVKFDAADDYGLAKATLKYKLDDGPERGIPLQLPHGVKSCHGQHDWNMSDLSAATTKPALEGSTLEFWLEVQDNNNVTGPGKGASEHYGAKIVTEEQMRQELFGELNDVLNKVKGETENQESLRDSLGGIIKEKPPEPPK